MYCTHCGKTITNDSRFCTYCGARVTGGGDAPRTGTQNPGANGKYTKTWTGVNVKSQEQIKQTAQQYQKTQQKQNPAPVVVQPKTEISTSVRRDTELSARVLGIPMTEKAATSVYLFVLIATLIAGIFGL